MIQARSLRRAWVRGNGLTWFEALFTGGFASTITWGLPGDNYGSATAINNLGHILGSSAYSTPGTWDAGPSRLFIWRDGGVFELQSLLDPASGEGWTITSVSGINNLGQIIGSGLHNGQPASFVMTPTVP